MNNLIIREALQNTGLKQWQGAEAVGMTEWTFSRKLRNELPKALQEEYSRKILKHAEEIKNESART